MIGSAAPACPHLVRGRDAILDHDTRHFPSLTAAEPRPHQAQLGSTCPGASLAFARAPPDTPKVRSAERAGILQAVAQGTVAADVRRPDEGQREA